MTTDLTGLIPHGWSGGEAVKKWWRGSYLHLYRLRKNCAQCGREMTIDVTKAAIAGTAKNAGLHLTRCAECRGASKAQGGGSRPAVRGSHPETITGAPDDAGENSELVSLRLQNEMFLRSVQALQAENDQLKAQFARFSLPGATEAAKPKIRTLPPEPLTMAQSTANINAELARQRAAFDPHKALAAEIARKNNFPWE